MAVKKDDGSVRVQDLQLRKIPMRIIGDTSLLVHKMSQDDAESIIKAATDETVTAPKKARTPFEEFLNALYVIEGNLSKPTEKDFMKAVKNGMRFGYPRTSIIKASNAEAYRMGWVKNQKVLQGAYDILAIDGNPDMLEIKGDCPTPAQHPVRIMGSRIIRTRPEFKSWYIDFILEYNEGSNVSLEQIVNIINLGGYVSGLGDFRPSCNGAHGRYHIDKEYRGS